MLAEVLLTMALNSNKPAYLRTAGPPYQEHELRLHINQQYKPFNYYSYPINIDGKVEVINILHFWKPILEVDVQPYIQLRGNVPSVAGGELDVGLWFKDLYIGFYHHSIHNLDQFTDGDGGVQYNAVKLKWRLQ